jgi:hypothetical protein
MWKDLKRRELGLEMRCLVSSANRYTIFESVEQIDYHNDNNMSINGTQELINKTWVQLDFVDLKYSSTHNIFNITQ